MLTVTDVTGDVSHGEHGSGYAGLCCFCCGIDCCSDPSCCIYDMWHPLPGTVDGCEVLVRSVYTSLVLQMFSC